MEHIIDNFYYNYGLAEKVYGGWIFQVNTFEKDRMGYDCFYFYGNYRIWIENFDKAIEGLKYRVLADVERESLIENGIISEDDAISSHFYRMYEKLVEENGEEEEEEEEQEE